MLLFRGTVSQHFDYPKPSPEGLAILVTVGMVTPEEWKKLAKAVQAESGQKIEWRTHDEIMDADDPTYF